jgi:hypothetical protein
MSLLDQGNSIVGKLKRNELTRSDLSAYFKLAQNNLQEVKNLNTTEEVKNVSTPFLAMLTNESFSNNDYVGQTISAEGYYSASYYIQTKILDEFNIPKPQKLIDFVELLKLRLTILLSGKHHFPDLLFRVPKNPNISEYWTPLSSSGTSDTKGFKDMVMADAGLLTKYANSPLIGAFQQDGLNLANSVLSDNKNLLVNFSIEDLIKKGLVMHNLLFNFLDNTLDRDGKLDFHSDDDDD